MKKVEFLLAELNKKIKMFGDDSRKHKKMHRGFRYAAFAFSAIASLLAGLALYLPGYQTTFNVVILTIGALSGVIASIEGIRKPDELWIHERTTFHLLNDLKREIEYKQTSEMTECEVDELFARLQSLLTNAGEKWSSGIVGLSSDSEQT